MEMFENNPKYRKRMVICTPFGKFENGDQKGVMTKARLKSIAERARTYPRQIKAYLNGDHPMVRSERPADGWFANVEYTESYPGYPDGALVADLEAHGTLAQWVAGDLVRGASIGTVHGNNPDGSPQGEVLDHVLISDDNFDKRVNIAASLPGGESAVVYFTTALPKKEAAMADQKDEEIARLKDELAAMKAQTPDEKVAAQLQEAQSLLQEKLRENAELQASNENLKADVEKFKSPKAIEELNLQLKSQERQLRAGKIRRLVKDGVAEGQFNVAMVGDPKTGYDHASDEMVLAWFKASPFKDSFDKLEFALATFEKKRLNKRVNGAGDGLPVEEVAMTEQDREAIRLMGKDPDKVLAAMKAKDANHYAALTAKE